MSFNFTFHLHSLDLESNPQQVPRPRNICYSAPCLPARLAGTAFIQREAELLAPSAILKQLRRSPPSSPTLEDDFNHGRSPSSSSAASSSLPASPTKRKTDAFTNSPPWKEPQPFEVLRAVEKKDIMTLMEIRDRAFHILLRKSGDVTPLLHAMRIGPSHREVAIILLGSFSRWINNLDDADFRKPRTKSLLKALRANLKLAIDYGLAKSQSDLIASFLQTLIMAEGEGWVREQVANVSIALRAGTAGKPVKAADMAVRRFATKELGKAELIATLEDYIANATVDLVLMAAWSSVVDVLHGEQIPVYYFARDDRVYKAFSERVHEQRVGIRTSLGKRLKWQLRVLNAVLEGRSTTYRRKVELLAGELDEGIGV